MKNSNKKIIQLLVTLSIIFSMFSTLSAFDGARVTTKLADQMSLVTDGELIKINIALEEQVDYISLINQIKSFNSKDEKRDFVINELKDFSNNTQTEILDFLTLNETSNKVESIKSLWIVNLINCYATKDVIEELSLRDDIRDIDFDKLQAGVIIGNVSDSESFNSPKSVMNNKQIEVSPKNKGSREITWNVTQVNGDDVWALGFDGSGVIVAVIDTGVNYNHQDLADHVWDGGATYPNHGYDFAYNDNDPMDGDGHGTHCAGTIAGDGTAGSQTGIAPEATIMCLKVLDDNGSGYESAVWNAVQFAIDNNADVLSLSLGWPQSSNPNNPTWRDTFNNALAAGIVASVASGNERSSGASAPDNCRTPGIAPPPWTNPDQTLTGGNSSVVCVGATDISDNIASFSSYGPSTWEGETGYDDYHFNPEMGLIRPDISAPGVNIKSLAYNSNTGYVDGWSGTSMATPLVAGVMALMVDKKGSITPAEISQLLEENTYNAPIPKDNDFGAGIVDALASVNAVSLSGEPTCDITNPTNGDIIMVGDVVTIEANASDPTKSVSLVEFYIDNAKIGDDSVSPYSLDWNTIGYSLGSHEIHAVATDNEGNFTSSSVVNITLSDGTTPVVLYDQSQQPSFESARPAQDFEAPNDAYDCQGADDFTVPAGETWHISTIYAGGTTSGTTPQLIELVNIVIYDDNAGSIGAVNYVINNVDAVPDSSPNLTIALPNVVVLESGTYWLSVQDATPYATAGQWFWSKQAAPTITYENYWRNPGGGFGVGAAEWTAASVVWTDDLDYNLTFIIYGIMSSDIGDNNLIKETALYQNYPNPFNPITTIKFFNKISGSVKLSIYNVKGELVNFLVNDKNANTGFQTVKFDASGLNSGVYYYKLETPEKTLTKKMILVK